MSEIVLFEIRDSIAWITMNRPEALNAMDTVMKEGLRSALMQAEFDERVRVVVLRGAGKHFQAGGDLLSFNEALETKTKAELQQYFHTIIHQTKLVTSSIRRMKKPVIAAVQGHAVGFGLSLAIMCDFTIAAHNAQFTLGYVNIGNSPDGATSYYLPRLLGLKKAMEITMLGEQLDSQQALDMGLINYRVANDKLAEETQKLAERLAHAPTQALGSVKKLMHHSLHNDWDSQLQLEEDCFVDNVVTDDFKEGIRSFVEKRPRAFTGK